MKARAGSGGTETHPWRQPTKASYWLFHTAIFIISPWTSNISIATGCQSMQTIRKEKNKLEFICFAFAFESSKRRPESDDVNWNLFLVCYSVAVFPWSRLKIKSAGMTWPGADRQRSFHPNVNEDYFALKNTEQLRKQGNQITQLRVFEFVLMH